MADEKSVLYERILETAGEMIADLETLLDKASEDRATDERLREIHALLADRGALMRKKITDFLNSEAVSDLDGGLVYEAKRHVHTDLGRAISSSSISEWREVLSSLRSGEWRREEVDAVAQIRAAAAAAGVVPVFESAIPDDEGELRLWIRDAAAKIMAAARAGEGEVRL